LSFSVKENELLAIVGPVGSGKTAVLETILGEVPSINGNIKIDGSIFYVPNKPWIFPSTIKQNILFGKEYSKEKFDEIIEICALKDVRISLNNNSVITIFKNIGFQRVRTR
jgi:ABC-type multidrug transport system fused ATPase/permease subunit